LDFGALSARDQVARLRSGAVPVEEFDFAALRWDFGEPGRRALRKLAENGEGKAAELATAALVQRERVYPGLDRANRTRADLSLRVQPEDPRLRALVMDYLVANPWQCADRCVAVELDRRPGGV